MIVVPAAAFVDHGWRILLLVGFRLRALGKPGSLRDPFAIQLSRLRDGKESLRHARAESFVHDSEIERHRNRSSFVGFGIVKLAIHHDGDRNEASLALIVNLHQTKRPRAFVGVLAFMMLGEFLGMGFGSEPEAEEGNRRQKRGGADDGAEPHTISSVRSSARSSARRKRNHASQ